MIFDPFEEKAPLVNPLPTPQVEEEVEEDEEDSILPEFLNK